MEARIEKCFELMYQNKLRYDDYLTFAKDEYGYHRNQANAIWVKARDIRNEYLRERLDDEITNAIVELEEYENEMLASDSNQADGLRLKAKDMKFKIKGLYTEKIRLDAKIDVINVQFDK
jgi:hypothetical protein